MRPIFQGFCKNRFGIGPLHYISSRSHFGFEIAEIFATDYEAKIGTARKVVKGTVDEPIYAKTSEKPLHCHVPLRLHGIYTPDSQELSSRGFLEDFFHPFIEKRRKGSTSYMLIVYTSSSTDEILDLEVT